MQRTQIYFEQDTLQELKGIAKGLNVSVSEFIRRVIKVEIKKNRQQNLTDFLANMAPVESFDNIDAVKYVNETRNKSRILND